MGDPFTSWRQNTSGLAKAPNSRQKATKQSLTPPEKGGRSQEMNPTQKQFSLNRAASKKQIPITCKFLSVVICAFAWLAPKVDAALLQAQRLATNQVQLTWQSSSNFSQELEHSFNLLNWQIVMRPYPSQVTNSTITNVLQTALRQEFFRLHFSILTNTPVPIAPGMYPGLQLVSGGLTRSYRLFIPQNYNPTNLVPSPLAVILHGGGQTADQFAAQHPDLFNNANSNNMILVLPDSTRRDDTTSWMFNVPRPYEAEVGDTQFILDLVNVLKCALVIDNLRVYAGGFSNGGQMAHQLGITTTNVFAALASIGSTIAASQGTNPIVLPGPSLEPYPILIVNATNDCVRPYFGGTNSEGSQQSPALAAANYWVTNNGCTTNPIAYFVTNLVTNYNQVFRFETDCYPPPVTNQSSLVTNTAVLARFTSCGNAKSVNFITLTDGGHTWPDLNDNIGFDANAGVIAFFLQHARTNYVAPAWTGLQQINVTSPIQNNSTFQAQITLQNPGPAIIPCCTLEWSNPNLNILKFLTWNTPAGSTVVTNNNGDLLWDFARIPANSSLTLNVTGIANVTFAPGQEFFDIVSAVNLQCGGPGAFNTNITIRVLSPLDYGDAPTTYPTLLANNGARHSISALRLGASVDAEQNGFPSVNADGDDNNNTDDENGVQFLNAPQAGQFVGLAIFSSGNGFVDAWVDYNRDGTWTNGNEQILASFPVTSGSNHVSVLVDPSAVPTGTTGKTYWRFRLSSVGGLAPGGFAANGEVEDYATTMAANPGSGGNTNVGFGNFDWGDAPAPYQTLAVENGASHKINDGIRLGGGVDAEPNGQPQVNALGDDNNGDDEDGVAFNALKRGAMGIAHVNVTGGGFLNAWIDFNGDGDWNDAGEQIATSRYLITGGNPNQITFLVPANAATGATFARFRFGVDAALPPTGGANDGEVEDHRGVINP